MLKQSRAIPLLFSASLRQHGVCICLLEEHVLQLVLVRDGRVPARRGVLDRPLFIGVTECIRILLPLLFGREGIGGAYYLEHRVRAHGPLLLIGCVSVVCCDYVAFGRVERSW